MTARGGPSGSQRRSGRRSPSAVTKTSPLKRGIVVAAGSGPGMADPVGRGAAGAQAASSNTAASAAAAPGIGKRIIACAAAMRIIRAPTRSIARAGRLVADSLVHDTVRNHLCRGEGGRLRRRAARPSAGLSEPDARRTGRVPVLLATLCQPRDGGGQWVAVRWPRTTTETGKVDETVGRTPDQPQPHAAAGPLPLAPRHVFLIDGSGFIFRAYHARHGAPPLRRKSDGMPTEVVTLFSNMLDKLRRETDADHIAVIFDASGTSFRNRIYEQYKAHRPPPPEDLIPQFAHVRQAAEAFNICQIEMEGFEADDLIATYARHAVAAGAEVTIVSSDKDLMQLVGAHVRMLDPITYRMIGEAEVREKFGVGPDKVVDVQALCGDSVDNVPGVPGIGVKTAAELINAYGDLETLLAHAHEIKQPKRRQALIEHEKQARLSKELVKLDDHVPLPCPLSALAAKPYDPEKLFPFLDAMELRALKTRIAQRLSAPAAAPPAEPVIPEMPPFSAPRRYELLDSAEGLERWIAMAQQDGVVAIWPEASAVPGRRPELCGLALAIAPGLAAYVPLAHRTAGEPAGLSLRSGLSPTAALARLKPLLEDPGVLKIGHDMKAAAGLLRHGIVPAPWDCTMLMSYVLDGGQFEHTIETLTRRTFAHELTSRKELIGTGKSLIPFAEVAPERARDFAAERADAALRLHAVLKARLVRD